MKVRSRKFEGRCARHKGYNPAVDGPSGIVGGCPRCQLLHDIWAASIKLNALIRSFDPNHDDLRKSPAPKAAAVPKPVGDPRQMRLIGE